MVKEQQKKYLISFILISYNRIEVLLECIASIKGQTYSDIEIVLVDNASSDGTAATIRRSHPDIRLICSEVNLGVPGARNLAIRHASGEIFAFIDDDCLIRDTEFASKLNLFFSKRDEVSILTFKIINYFTNKINRHEFPHRNKKLSDHEFETSYFLGGANAIRRQVFESIGEFYSDYFYGFEELDFSFRAMEHDFRMFYSPRFEVFHKTSADARPSWRSVYFFTRNRIWFAFSFLPWYFIVSQLIIWFSFFFFTAVKIRHPMTFFQGIKDGLRGLPKIYSRRKNLKISKTLMKKIFNLKGRLLY
ncbi:MAG TPA: glycosyltransferase family 2 protein [bacterium]|nr:glycosyltransferase family 2 protein [bacterium]